ncbi:MAG: hypothetical protein M1820_007006 [Bogoriella megaspora]|nr:MAG: hypothetical protein M1820_007006 [Bogoriella megaspora]
MVQLHEKYGDIVRIVLAEYCIRIQTYVDQLEGHLAKTSGRSVGVTDLFNWFSFDIMGDLALGTSFNMLLNSEWHFSMSLLRGFMSLLGLISPVPWLAHILISVPGATREWNRTVQYCKSRMVERIESGVEKLDVCHWLIDHSLHNESIEEDMPILYGDAISLIIAGSETVGITLTWLFFNIVQHPEHQQKIREELKEVQNVNDPKLLTELPHLNAVINETLRLFPPVPTGGLRETGSNGMQLGDIWIPPATIVSVPRYVVSRLDKYFPEGGSFIPERWYSRPELIRDKRAFEPFSQGRYGCIGKQLALAELRLVVARLVSKYEIEFASGEDGTRVFAGIKDHFTAPPGNLNLVFHTLE